MTQLGDLWAEHHRVVEKSIRYQFRLSYHDAEEIVASATVKLLDRSGDIGVGLLRKTAADLATDFVRTRIRRDELDAEISPLFAEQVALTVEGAMFRADFDRAFRQLPVEQAKAFALTELRGLSERETAHVLGVSQMTINRRCEAARTYLAKELS